MSEIKLKPCPFCGGKAYYRTPTHLKGTAFDVMTVECKQCGASPYAVEVYEYDTEENKRKAIAEFWNRRVDNAALVHAYWKRVDKDDGGHDTVCSHCSTPIVTYLETPYCHNCGAKMDGGD